MANICFRNQFTATSRYSWSFYVHFCASNASLPARCTERQTSNRYIYTLELHTAVDLCALFIAGRDQCPDKRVVVPHRRPPHLRKTMSTVLQYVHVNRRWLHLSVRLPNLEESDPVVTGPGVLGTDCVVAVNPALREVAAAHVPKLHTLLHGPQRSQGSSFSTCGKNNLFSLEKMRVYMENWVKGKQTRPNQRCANIYSVQDDTLAECSWREEHRT